MAQFVLRNSPEVIVEFSVINRTNKVALTNLIDEKELREQLDNVKTYHSVEESPLGYEEIPSMANMLCSNLILLIG